MKSRSPLVAPCEPYRPRHRAGIGTLAASPGCRARHRASTLCAALDTLVAFIRRSRLRCQSTNGDSRDAPNILLIFFGIVLLADFCQIVVSGRHGRCDTNSTGRD